MNAQPVVLYVEDDPLNRKMMQMLLKNRLKLPHVTLLEDSTDFVKVVQALAPRPDVIFLDIHVRPYNGFEMLTLLRSLNWAASIPIVALTASVMNEEVNQLMVAGFNGCLAKPIDMDTFPNTITRILSGEAVWQIMA